MPRIASNILIISGKKLSDEWGSWFNFFIDLKHSLRLFVEVQDSLSKIISEAC